MSEAESRVFVAAIALVGSVITGIVAIVVAFIATRVVKVSSQVATVASDLTRVELKVDGKMDKLLEASIGKATAEGIATGEQAQRDRASAPEGSEPTPVTIANPPDAPVPVDQAPPK